MIPQLKCLQQQRNSMSSPYYFNKISSIQRRTEVQLHLQLQRQEHLWALKPVKNTMRKAQTKIEMNAAKYAIMASRSPLIPSITLIFISFLHLIRNLSSTISQSTHPCKLSGIPHCSGKFSNSSKAESNRPTQQINVIPIPIKVRGVQTGLATLLTIGTSITTKRIAVPLPFSI